MANEYDFAVGYLSVNAAEQDGNFGVTASTCDLQSMIT